MTLVLYLGEEEWNGARCIHNFVDFSGNNQKLKPFISNYSFNLLEVAKEKELKNMIHKNERIGDTMCRAFEENREYGRTLEKQTAIITVLKRIGTIHKSLEIHIQGEMNLDILNDWFHKALDAVSIEDFESKIFT